jgi:hypothetical protein
MSKYIKNVIRRKIKDNDPFSGWDVYFRNVAQAVSRMETRLDVLRKWMDAMDKEVKSFKGE